MMSRAVVKTLKSSAFARYVPLVVILFAMFLHSLLELQRLGVSASALVIVTKNVAKSEQFFSLSNCHKCIWIVVNSISSMRASTCVSRYCHRGVKKWWKLYGRNDGTFLEDIETIFEGPCTSCSDERDYVACLSALAFWLKDVSNLFHQIEFHTVLDKRKELQTFL